MKRGIVLLFGAFLLAAATAAAQDASVQQGRTQLSQALMTPDFDQVMVPEAFKARTMLEDAGAQVKQAAAGLDAQIAKAADPALKKKLEGDRLQADLNLALNLFDLA